MKAPTISQRIWLVISTVGVIGGFFAYYFFVYMENRKVDLEAKKFRTLEQYAVNIKTAYDERTKKLALGTDDCTPDTMKCIPIAVLNIVRADTIKAISRANLEKLRAGSLSCVPFTMAKQILFAILSAVEFTQLEKLFYDQLSCVNPDSLKRARADVTEPIFKQSDFSDLVFEVNSVIERQTFQNSIDTSILNTMLRKENAAIKREVEFNVNNKDYIIFIHSFELAGKQWRIFGFCDKHEFDSQVKAVDLKFVVSAALLLILILLMMPLLKLWIMNESEKLHMTNVWFCGFSLVVGSSFLLLIVLMINDFSTSYNSTCGDDSMKECLGKDRESRIKNLSVAIEGNFLIELRSIYNQIGESKEDFKKNGLHTPTTELYSNVLKNDTPRFSCYPFFNEILWIRRDGSQDMAVATHELRPTEVVNLKKRKYFSHALSSDSSWMMPDRETTDERFALQSIHSYLTNHHEAGFGTIRDSKDTLKGVLAIATKLHSIMDPLLPPGYQFVMIDKKGKVWFHSRTEKNLNENFFNETGEDRTLVAAVEGRSAVTMNITYDRSNHLAYIKPIRNTELFLVVFHDDDFFNTPIIFTVGFAFFLVFLLFFIQGIHQLILVITTYRFTLLKVRRFFLIWLRPQKEKEMVYRNSVKMQLLLLLLCCCIVWFLNSLSFAICFLTLPLYLTVYHYFSLEHERLIQEKETESRELSSHPFLLASVLLALFINFSGLYLLDIEKFAIPFGVQVVFVVILITFYRVTTLDRSLGGVLLKVISRIGQAFEFIVGFLERKGLPAVRLVTRLNKFENSYQAFLFLWLILTSIIPTYYFYKVGYYEEGKIWMRYLQVTAAQQQESRDVQLANELQGTFGDRMQDIKHMGDYLNVTMEINGCAATDSTEYEVRRETIHDLMFNSAPPLSGVAGQSRSVILPAAGDKMWYAYEHDLTSRIKYLTNQGEWRSYLSTQQRYRSFKGDYWSLLLVTTFLGALVLYRTIRFCITHIFGLGLLSERYKTPKLLPGARYFVVGLPHSGKSMLVRKIQGRKKISSAFLKEVDLNDPTPIEIRKDCQLVVATDFHLDINNHESNEKKLEKMEVFRKHKDVPVIIISNVEPSAILEFYDKMAVYYRHEKGDYQLDGDFRKCKQAFRRWKNILSGYSIHYHALRKLDQFNDQYINAEIGHGEYLPQLYHQLNVPILTMRDREKMVLLVENLAQTYYHAMWNCLSSAEKFLLHDLAKDRFVNMRNMKTIRALRQKGILVVRNSLQIMNMSFNNFILSIVQEDTDIKMEEQIRSKGSWNTLHLILVIAILSIIVFLGIAQQELFKNFQAILAATTALLPLLARFGGIFTGSKGKD